MLLNIDECNESELLGKLIEVDQRLLPPTFIYVALNGGPLQGARLNAIFIHGVQAVPW